MAIIEYYIGNHGPYFADDTDPSFASENQLARRVEIADVVDATTVSGMVKGDGSVLSAATPDVDYATPFTGITAVIVTAKLTAIGTDGSMTFTNGILTASTPAT